MEGGGTTTTTAAAAVGASGRMGYSRAHAYGIGMY